MSNQEKSWLSGKVKADLDELQPQLREMSDHEIKNRLAQCIRDQAGYLDSMMKHDRRQDGGHLGTLNHIRPTEIANDHWLVFEQERQNRGLSLQELSLQDLHGLIFTSMKRDYLDLLKKLRRSKTVSEAEKPRVRMPANDGAGGDGSSASVEESTRSRLRQHLLKALEGIEQRPDERVASAVDELSDRERNDRLAEAVKSLPPLEQRVIEDRFGGHAMSSREDGALRLGITAKQYRAAEERAVDHLQKVLGIGVDS
jgi:DNA-directed RNA polymerase specialized sigma24 family protein